MATLREYNFLFRFTDSLLNLPKLSCSNCYLYQSRGRLLGLCKRPLIASPKRRKRPIHDSLFPSHPQHFITAIAVYQICLFQWASNPVIGWTDLVATPTQPVGKGLFTSGAAVTINAPTSVVFDVITSFSRQIQQMEHVTTFRYDIGATYRRCHDARLFAELQRVQPTSKQRKKRNVFARNRLSTAHRGQRRGFLCPLEKAGYEAGRCCPSPH
jgi:hypothetical protein